MVRKLKDVVVWLCAAMLAAALLVGSPLLLFAAGDGWPGPSGIPTGEELGAFFTDRLTDENVIAVFVIVGWLLWAHFVWVFMVEFIDQVRDRESKDLHTAAITHRAARFVVAGLFRLGATSTAILGVVGPTAGVGAVVAMAGSVGAAELSEGVSIDPDIESGGLPTTIDISDITVSPREGRVPYLVVEDDTLWDISETHTGDPQRWREIFDASEGFTQPGADDRVLTEPRLINPGMVLLLPGDALEVPAVDEALVEAVYGAASDLGTDALESASGDDEPTIVEEGTDVADDDVSYEDQIGALDIDDSAADDSVVDLPEVSVPESAGQDLVETLDEPEVSGAEIDVAIRSAFGFNATTAAVGFGAGGALFATFVAARLARQKRWARSNRQPGEAVADLDDEAAELERELFGAADFDQADFYGRAWRSLATRPMEKSDDCQPLLAIRHADELQVLMSEPRKDAPFPWTCATVEDDRAVWSLPIDEGTLHQLPEDSMLGGLPLMVTVGENVFLNLESVGPFGLSGDLSRVVGMARSMMWESVTSPWIDGLDVRVTQEAARGLGLDIGTDVVTIDQEITARALLATTTLESHGVANIHVARAILDADLYPSLVIADSSDVDDLAGALEATRERRSPVGIILLGDRASDYSGEVDAAGELVLSPSGLRARAAFAEVDRGEMVARLEEQRLQLVNRSDGTRVDRVIANVFDDSFEEVTTVYATASSNNPVPEQDEPVQGEPCERVEPIVLVPRVDSASDSVDESPVVGASQSSEAAADEAEATTREDCGAGFVEYDGVALYSGTAPAEAVCLDGDYDLVDGSELEAVDEESVVGEVVLDLSDDAPTNTRYLYLEILGDPRIDDPRADKLTEGGLSLLAFLAVEGDQSRQGVQAAMYGAGAEVGRTTLRSFVSRARKQLGPAHFPPASDGRYRVVDVVTDYEILICLLYTSPSPRDKRQSRMPSSA